MASNFPPCSLPLSLRLLRLARQRLQTHIHSLFDALFKRPDMLFSTIIFCFLTLFSIASAAVIPIRRINTHLRSHNEIRRHARFVAERDTSTSSTQTLTATSSPSPSASSTSSTSEPSAQPSQPPVDADGSRKYVVAHHMVGNTFPFKLEDWVQDITLAHASGIDGFALNMGRDDWQPDRVNDA